MTTWLLQDEFTAMRARFRRALAVSLGAHALLAAGLMLAEGARSVPPRIVEITWLEAATIPTVPPPPAPRATVEPLESPKQPVPAAARPREGVAAESATARTAGAPGSRADERRREQLAHLAATRDGLADRLGPSPMATAAGQLPASAPTGGSELARLASATMMPVADRGRPVALARGPQTAGSVLPLARGQKVAGGAGAVLAALPAAAVARAGDGDGTGTAPSRAAATPVRGGDTSGDILIEGPAAGREVLSRALPTYPDWARRQAVEAVVSLHFTVLPDGRVREDVRVERTGGFGDFDERAVAAFRQWRFAPLGGGDAAGQWGTITFHFRLRG